MKIKDVLKPFVQELNSFLEHHGNKNQQATEDIIDGEIYIMIGNDYINVNMRKSYWYHEDDGTIVFRVNDMTDEDLADLEADELDNMVRDTLPDDDYFEMNHYFD